jgi:hypothetical protein
MRPRKTQKTYKFWNPFWRVQKHYLQNGQRWAKNGPRWAKTKTAQKRPKRWPTEAQEESRWASIYLQGSASWYTCSKFAMITKYPPCFANTSSCQLCRKHAWVDDCMPLWANLWQPRRVCLSARPALLLTCMCDRLASNMGSDQNQTGYVDTKSSLLNWSLPKKWWGRFLV